MKVAISANIGFTITNFRSELIQSLKDKGHDVILVCSGENDFNKAMEQIDCPVYHVSLDRRGINPISDFRLFLDYLKLYRRVKPDLILNYTIKPVIYSSLASKVACKAKNHSFITGLGFLFINTSLKTRLLKLVAVSLYKLSALCNQTFFFQNKDDLKLFLDEGILSKEKTHLINGSGVNLKKFQPKEIKKQPKSFVFVGRLLKDKGIYELIEAAKKIKLEEPESKFFICGNIDSNPASVKKEEIESWIQKGTIEHINFTDDIKSYLQDKEVFILPSYREGTPRSSLEAMAMGMPIITTDVPGCRETVVQNRNGLLVPVKSSTSLYDAIKYFLKNPEGIGIMGKESLKIVREKYDVVQVNKSIIDRIGL